MGCDIHICIEVKNNDGEWRNYDNFRHNPYYVEGDECEEEIIQIPIFTDRDYLLFSRLCGVREHSIFDAIAISTLDENIQLQKTEKVSDVKGVPSDCSVVTKQIIDKWGSDGHSHSFLTLKEIKDYINKKSSKKYHGFLTSPQSKLLAEGILPDYWSRVETEEYINFAQWERPWSAEIDGNMIALANAIEKRAKEFFYSDDVSEKTRIVFFFDN